MNVYMEPTIIVRTDPNGVHRMLINHRNAVIRLLGITSETIARIFIVIEEPQTLIVR